MESKSARTKKMRMTGTSAGVSAPAMSSLNNVGAIDGGALTSPSN